MKRVPVDVPSDTEESQRKKNILVSVSAESKMYIGEEEINPSIFDSILRVKIDSLRLYTDWPTVVIKVDSSVAYGFVYKIMQLAAKSHARVVATVK